tara:strand:- start:53 stop:802 length:750 start_codon:yes stop_codon:yes gene_type:complete
MSSIHQHTSPGKATKHHRAINILGPDGTLMSAGTKAGYTTADNNVLDDGLNSGHDANIEVISAVSVNKSAFTITFTTADSLGSNVFDSATGGVLTQGFHGLLDGHRLDITSTDDDTNTTTATLPDHIAGNAAVLKNFSPSARGRLIQHSTKGVATNGADKLWLTLKDSTSGSPTVSVCVYQYAFGVWSRHKLYNRGAHTTTSTNFANATFTADSAHRSYVIPIQGADRIFLLTSADDNDLVVGAAVSWD